MDLFPRPSLILCNLLILRWSGMPKKATKASPSFSFHSVSDTPLFLRVLARAIRFRSEARNARMTGGIGSLCRNASYDCRCCDFVVSLGSGCDAKEGEHFSRSHIDDTFVGESSCGGRRGTRLPKIVQDSLPR